MLGFPAERKGVTVLLLMWPLPHFSVTPFGFMQETFVILNNPLVLGILKWMGIGFDFGTLCIKESGKHIYMISAMTVHKKQ